MNGYRHQLTQLEGGSGICLADAGVETNLDPDSWGLLRLGPVPREADRSRDRRLREAL